VELPRCAGLSGNDFGPIRTSRIPPAPATTPGDPGHAPAQALTQSSRSLGEATRASAELRRALTERTKAERVDFLIDLAEADRGVPRRLVARFDGAATADERAAATRQAIADATAFDPRDINRNVAYDHVAYAEVKRDLGRLIASGELRLAMTLARELRKRGSHQVEMSDEGLMPDEIEGCLSVVIEGVRTSDVPAEETLAWCLSLLGADHIGFIARATLETLRARVEASDAK